MIKNLYKVLQYTKDMSVNLFIYRVIKLFLNICYPIYCGFNKTNSKMIHPNVIVSLTSFPARINSVWIVIETLLRQTYRPEKIILWLAESQFESMDMLPDRLLRLQERGLEIKFCEDLRSHKKYYYTMQNYPDAVVITVDDDTFYPEDLVQNLMDTHHQYPNAICCNLGHVMVVKEGQIAPYAEWKSVESEVERHSHYLVPIGCEGVLYPPHCLDKNVFDKEQIKKLAPLADDLWLKAMSTLNDIKAIQCKTEFITYANLMTAKNNSLSEMNVVQNMNDKQIANIVKSHPELKSFWK